MMKLLLSLALVGLAACASVHHEPPQEHHDPNHHQHHNDGLIHVDDHFIVHDEKEEEAQPKQAYAINYCGQYYWPTGSYPYPSDCRKYIQCANGVTNVMSCPATTVFNPNLKVCDNYANVPYCNYNAPANVNPIYVNNYCTQNNYGNGVYFHPYDCSQYINCNFGVTQVNACPVGTIYDNAQRACIGYQGVVRPNSNPYCSQYVFNAPVYPANPQPGYANYCASAGLTNGIHPDPYNCYGYIQCTFGQTAHQSCPAGLSFDRNLLVCDDQRYNNCNGAGLIGPIVGKK